jgi:hypothetical protein
MNNAANHLRECHSCWKMVRTTVRERRAANQKNSISGNIFIYTGQLV